MLCLTSHSSLRFYIYTKGLVTQNNEELFSPLNTSSNKNKQQNYLTNTRLNQDLLKSTLAVTKYSINLVYLDEFQHILKMIPKTTEFKIEENNFGKLQLRMTVWFTVKDIGTNSFYDIVYNHLIDKRIENGNIFNCVKSISKIKIFISKKV